MAAITRPGQEGIPRQPHGRFVGQGLHDPGRLTRLGLAGVPRGLYGEFTHGTATQPPGGGAPSPQRKGGKRYPRYVYIDGKRYLVRNANEERALLRAYRDRLEAERRKLEASAAPKGEVVKAKVRVVRAERRIEKVIDREEEWLNRLRSEDEELLVLLH